ncbi:MAG TPA: hypothetical protein DIT25_01070 [Candidatus Moranbacteria bacterium]|nr:hypothetical protein [Candidatus Moranbacteria bacterium]
MFNILLTLILPFIPVWMYGNFSDIANVQNPGCETDQSACPVQTKVLGEEAVSGEKDSNLGNYNIFPIDRAQAAAFIPVRKNNVPDVRLWAGSAVAIDVDSGTILHYENGRKRTQIASLTKMMTAVVVVENLKDLEEEVTITKEALNVPGTRVGCPSTTLCNSNRMYAGEKIKAVDILKALLMNSANDAANALAIHTAGSVKDFVGMMNEKAREIGLKDTNFCTPSGLEIDGKEDQCYSTAYDIARISAYSLQYEKIWEIMRIPEGRFYSTDGKYMHELKNTDILLDTLPNCIGGKTGFTPLAGRSLMMAMNDPTRKHRVIAVVLDDPKRWENIKFLSGWIFDNYSWR